MKIRFELFDWVIGLVILVIGCFCETVNTNASNTASVQSTSSLTSTLTLPSFAPLLPLSPQDDKIEPEQAKRLAFVRTMMKEAWAGYVKCAMGKQDFKPIYCENRSESYKYVWPAMPTLWIMGLRNEFNSAREWLVQNGVQLQLPEDFAILDIFFGAMLSCYALTGDTFFLDSALKSAPPFIAQFDPTVNLIHNWQNTMLEMPYLAHLTGNQSYLQFYQQIEQAMSRSLERTKTLQSKLYRTKGDYMLLKVKPKIGQFYREVEELKEKQYLNRTQSGLWYFGGVENIRCKYEEDNDEGDERNFIVKMCSLGSILSLDAQLLPKLKYGKSSWRELSVDQFANVIQHWEMARNITDTCYWASKLSTEYMIPFGRDYSYESCYLLNITSPNIAQTIIKNNYHQFDLDSYQLLESYFTLWRTTGEQRYRDYAWELTQKIYQYARAFGNGYTNGVPKDIEGKNDIRNYQPSLFYTTLSYLYLMFTPDTYLSLDKWVFTVTGHPLPICGHNSAYPNVKCS